MLDKSIQTILSEELAKSEGNKIISNLTMSSLLFKFTETETTDGYYIAEIRTMPQAGESQIYSCVEIRLPIEGQVKVESLTAMMRDFFERIEAEKYVKSKRRNINQKDDGLMPEIRKH